MLWVRSGNSINNRLKTVEFRGLGTIHMGYAADKTQPTIVCLHGPSDQNFSGLVGSSYCSFRSGRLYIRVGLQDARKVQATWSGQKNAAQALGNYAGHSSHLFLANQAQMQDTQISSEVLA